MCLSSLIYINIIKTNKYKIQRSHIIKVYLFLLEGLNVHRLNFLRIKSLQSLLNFVHRDLGINNGASDFQKVHSKSQRKNFVSFLPGQTVLLNISIDSFCQGLKVLVDLKPFDFQDNS